ncbi:MAG TPA: hypothetical protein VM512_15170 [Burkholderiaceae bacterium]|nr:hypothetical protein [Burkholderiaceae bacterium]
MKRLALLAAILPFSCFAQNDSWVLIARSTDAITEWSIQKGSFESITTKGGKPISVVVGRTTDKRTKEVDLAKWYVTDADCDRGLGTIVTLSVTGAFRFENPFVKDSGSIASSIADAICDVRGLQLKAREEKGI